VACNEDRALSIVLEEIMAGVKKLSFQNREREDTVEIDGVHHHRRNQWLRGIHELPLRCDFSRIDQPKDSFD
jgi:hypothetical protein